MKRHSLIMMMKGHREAWVEYAVKGWLMPTFDCQVSHQMDLNAGTGALVQSTERS